MLYQITLELRNGNHIEKTETTYSRNPDMSAAIALVTKQFGRIRIGGVVRITEVRE